MKSRKYLRDVGLALLLLAGVISPTQAADQILRSTDHPGFPEVGMYPLTTSGEWLAAGAPYAFQDSFGIPDGRVLLWKRNASGVWEPKQIIQTQGAVSGTNTFGSRLVMDGKRLLVAAAEGGTYLDAYVLTPGGTWVPDGRLTLQGKDFSGGNFGNSFGTGFAVSGDLAVVGCYSGTIGGMQLAGWADVYQRVPSGWVHKARLSEPETGTQFFGYHVAIKDGKIFIGSHQENLPEENGETIGSVISVYEKSGSQWVKTRSLPVPGNPRWGLISWPFVAGNRLIGRNHNTNYEYSLTSPYPMLGQLPGDLENGVTVMDVLGETVVRSAGGTTSEITLYHRQADQTWDLAQTFEREDYNLNAVYQLKLAGHQLLVLGDPGVTGTLGAISVLSTSAPPQMEHSGMISAFTQDGDVTRLDAGEHLATANVPSLVTLTAHQSDQEAGVLEVAATGDTGDFHLSATSLNLVPGDDAELRVRLKPGDVGEKSITLTFTVQGQATPVRTYEITARRVSAATPLAFVQEPKPALCQPREVAAFSVQVQGTGPITYRWLKDGQVIPGATSATLWSGDAGSYQVEVTNPAGILLSTAVPQVIYSVEKQNLYAPPGGSGQLSLNLAGPGAQIQWERDGLPLTEGPDYTGVDSPVLTLNNVQDSFLLTARITLASGSTVLEVQPKFGVECLVLNPEDTIYSEMDAQYAPAMVVGQRTEFRYTVGVAAATFTFAGLPPGLAGDASGLVTGVPKKAGAFNTFITASFGGVTVQRTARLNVRGVGPLAGIYFNFMDPMEGVPHGGSVTLDVQTSGAFTGTVQIGATRSPFAGTVSGGGITESAPVALAGTSYVGWIRAEYGMLSFWLREASAPASSAIYMTAPSLIRAHGPQITSAEAGKYTFGVLNQGSQEVQGSGYGTMNITKKGAASYVGKLADGSALTGSSWVSDRLVEYDSVPRMYIYQWTQGNTGFVRGFPTVDRTFYEGNYFFDWTRLPAPGRVYPEGFGPMPLAFAASRYAKPAPAPVVPGDAHQISFQSLEAALDPTAFVLNDQNKAVFGAGPANPLKTKLNINANTGLFTGEFTLKDPDPAGGSALITRKVTYLGVVLTEFENGVGHYLLPTLPDPNATPPTTLTTSPIVSGSVLIEAAP